MRISRYCLYLFFSLTVSNIALAQVYHTVTISGSASVCLNNPELYTATDYFGNVAGTWIITANGNITSYSSNNSCYAKWAGGGTLTFHAAETICTTVYDPPVQECHDEYYCDYDYDGNPYNCGNRQVCNTVYPTHEECVDNIYDGSLAININNNGSPPSAVISASNSSQYQGATILTASPATGYFYQWQLNGVDLLGKTSAVCQVENSGSYTVKLTANSCYTISPGLLVYIPSENVTTTNVLVSGITDEAQLLSLNVQSGQVARSVQYLNASKKPMQVISRQSSPSASDVVSVYSYDNLGRQVISYAPISVAQSSGYYVPNLLGSGSYTGSPHQNFYLSPSDKIADDPAPYQLSKFELSPLSRSIQIGSIGQAWQPVSGSSRSVLYGGNQSGEVKRWFINDLGNMKYGLYFTYYNQGAISITTSTDEQGHTSKLFKDIDGRTICLKSQVNGSVWAETDYVYDDFGDLRFVLPPEALVKVQQKVTDNPLPDNYVLLTQNTELTISSFAPDPETGEVIDTFWYLEGVSITLKNEGGYLPVANVRPFPQSATSTLIHTYAYQYVYDNLHRKIAEKVPGTDWKYFVYDRLDQLVLTQDGNQRLTNQYSFSKYDDLGRPVISGLVTIAGTIDEVRSIVASQTITSEKIGAGGVLGYTNNAYPSITDPSLCLVATYYDSYSNCSFCSTPEYAFTSESWTNTSNEPFVRFYRLKDKVVASSVKVLGTNNWLNTVTHYNRNGQTIQTIGSNHLGGRDRVSNLVDFSGKKLEELHTAISYNNGGIAAMRKRFDYDHAGRLLKVYHKINGQNEVILSALEYNELGQVVKKKLHSEDGGTNYLQSLDFRYNIRGWLTNLNNIPSVGDTGDDTNDYFGLTMNYNNTVTGAGNNPRTDGLVSAINWKNDLSGKQRVYNFLYDNRKQLSGATHKMSSVAGNWGNEGDFFNEAGITYDLNGNIKNLNRNTEYFTGTNYNAEPIDQLTYEYGNGGNQLQFVKDNIASANKDKGFKDGGTNTVADPDYSYDANGNVTKDQNKGITNISYYFNNLPKRVTFADGSYLENIYDAARIKLSTVYSKSGTTVTTDYVGATVLLNGQVLVVNHEEGRITAPTYSNLMDNKDAGSTAGFPALGGAATITAEYVNAQTYVKVVANQAGYQGVFPINTTKGAGYPVKAGETYSFKILGYQSVGTNAYLYAIDQNNNNVLWPGAQLPVGAANENWVTSSIVIPAGVTQIKLGVLWNGANIGNTFFINKVALYNTDFEYNYFLDDQVGSPRVVLQTTPATITYMATMETENLPNESTKFQNLTASNIVMSPGNSTPGGNEVIKLNALNKIGPAKSIRVYPGDKINASAMSYYISQGGFSKTPAATMATILAPVFGGVAGAPGDPGSIFSNVGQAYGTSSTLGLSPDQGGSNPSAFLNFILFDKNYKPLDGKSVPISTTANAPQAVALPEITALEVGYVFIYLSYDNVTGGDVFFDDLKITVQESSVIQVNNYYPFGMQSYTWLREGETDNAYLFQGKELIAQTGWHDFGSRMYYGDLGRWFAVDPQKQFGSPYLAMGNMPMMGVDPDGEWVHILIGAVAGAVFNVVTNLGSIKNPVDFFKFAGVGAAGGAAGAATGNFALAGAIVGGGNTWAQGGNAQQIVMGAGIGAIAGGIGGSAGSAVGKNLAGGFVKGFVQGAVGGAVGGFTGGFLLGTHSTGDIGKGFQAGAKGALVGGLTGGVAGGLIGMINTPKNRNVWSGEEIAGGRGRFSLNNTPKGSIQPEEIVMNQFGSNPPIKIDYEAIYQKMMNHSFAKGRLNNIQGQGGDHLTAIEALHIIEQVSPMLLEGSNSIVTTVATQQVTIRVFVQNGTAISGNIFLGTSPRVLGTQINYNNH